MRILRKANGSGWTRERGYTRHVILPFENDILRDVQVQLSEIDPCQTVPLHYHVSQTEFIYFLEGKCRYMFENDVVEVEAGDLLVIEPGEHHATENLNQQPVRILTFKVGGNPNDTVWL